MQLLAISQHTCSDVIVKGSLQESKKPGDWQLLQLGRLDSDHLTLLNGFVNIESPVPMVFEGEKEKEKCQVFTL